MKIIYCSYKEVLRVFRKGLQAPFLGIACFLWAIFLLIVNTAILACHKAARGIRRAPMAAVVTMLFILAASNLALYASMKAKLTTAEWRYDRLLMHSDSVYEAYGIHNSYSRIVRYDK